MHPFPLSVSAATNAGQKCAKMSSLQDLASHMSTACDARRISCPRGCDSDTFPARALDVHLKYDCKFREVKCAACGDKVSAGDLDRHKSDTCRLVSVVCFVCFITERAASLKIEPSLFLILFLVHLLYLSPCFFLSLQVVNQIRGHIATSPPPPPPTTVRALHFVP